MKADNLNTNLSIRFLFVPKGLHNSPLSTVHCQPGQQNAKRRFLFVPGGQAAFLRKYRLTAVADRLMQKASTSRIAAMPKATPNSPCSLA